MHARDPKEHSGGEVTHWIPMPRMSGDRAPTKNIATCMEPVWLLERNIEARMHIMDKMEVDIT